MPTLVETVRSRWPAAADARPELAGLKDLAWRALDLSEAPPRRRAEIAAPGTLTEKGVEQVLRKDLADGYAKDVRNYRGALATQREALNARRAALFTPQFDKTDLIGELQRQELRAWLRSLGPSDRMIAILKDADGVVCEAALAAPATLSGIDVFKSEQREQIKAHFGSVRHAATLAEMDGEAEALQVAEIAVGVAVDAIRAEVGLPPSHFDTWLTTGVEPELEAA